MAKAKRHQWQPVPDKESMVKCGKCGLEAEISEARRGIGQCQGLKQKEHQQATPQRSSAKRGEKPALVRSDLGTCGACHKPLKQMPFNSKLDMVACANRRCDLYRERLRFEQAIPARERIALLQAEKA